MSEKSQQESVLKVLTYNIHKGYSVGNSRFVLHSIRDAIEDIHPDLVFLQEIQGQYRETQVISDSISDEPQFEFLADRLWPHYAYGKNAIYRAGHHGNAILSKHPFKFWENINVSKRRYSSRSLLHGVIDLGDDHKDLHVICIHLGLFENEREKQMLTLSERIAEHVPEGEPLIIAGDFNDWRGKAHHYLGDELQLREVFKTLTGRYMRTFPVWRPALRVDRIYYRGLKVIRGERLKGRKWRRLSDHTPLSAEFEI